MIFLGALCSLLILSSSFFPNQVDGQESENSRYEEIQLDRYPVEAVFNVDNAKPGDYATRIITVQNLHEFDVHYNVEVINVGAEKLFNEILLRLMHKEEIVFDGKLKDYQGVVDRLIPTNSEEVVEFYLKIPEELGNEFQGVQADFVIEFSAERAEEDTAISSIAGGNGMLWDDSGSVLPRTASPIFTFIIIGMILSLIGGILLYVNYRNKQFQD